MTISKAAEWCSFKSNLYRATSRMKGEAENIVVVVAAAVIVVVGPRRPFRCCALWWHRLGFGASFGSVGTHVATQLAKVLLAEHVSARESDDVRWFDVFLETDWTLVKLGKERQCPVATTNRSRAIPGKVWMIAGFVIAKDLVADGALEVGASLCSRNTFDITKHGNGSLHEIVEKPVSIDQ